MVLVAAKGDYGKPRPAVVVQDSRMADVVDSVTVCFLTTDLTELHGTLRVDISPLVTNGLHQPSQVQVEKLMTFPRDKVRGPIGVIEPHQLRAIEIGLMVHLGLAAPLGGR